MKARRNDKQDAIRWRWLLDNSLLGFYDAPSWDASITLPVFDSVDDTLTELVDRGRKATAKQRRGK